MGFRQDSYMTVWGTPRTGHFENTLECRLSASYKRQGTNEYIQDFGGWVSFKGEAYEKAKLLTERDRIKILKCDVKNNYVQEKGVTYTNYIVYDFEQVTDSGSRNTSDSTSVSKTKKTAPIAAEGDIDIEADDLPF